MMMIVKIKNLSNIPTLYMHSSYKISVSKLHTIHNTCICMYADNMLNS